MTTIDSEKDSGTSENVNRPNGIPDKIDDENHKMQNQISEIKEEDTRCGLGSFSPAWLQILASKKSFVIVYALAGMQQFVLGSYYIGTMSTLEKSFKMSSRMSGFISSAWDIGSLFTILSITYIAAKGHRTRWVAFGTLFVSVSSFMRVIPYLVFGPGENIKMYTKEYDNLFNDNSSFTNVVGNVTSIKKLSTSINCDKNNDGSDAFSFYILFISQLILGMGTAVYWTCGSTYLDDNARKNIVPTLLAVVQVIRLFGPTLGFLLSSYVLKIYVDPNLTPTITNEDPRWIGAWWIGWCPIGAMSLILAVLLAFFPKVLPRAALRKQSSPVVSGNLSGNLSLSDFKKSMGRILKNKIIVFNSFSSVCFAMGLMAYWTFMPKYMESQFRLSASKSNFLTGTVGILFNALGIMTAGLLISKCKPSPRFLAGWNVFVEFLDVIGHISYSMLSCPQQDFHGHMNSDHSWNLTEECNIKFGCGTDIQYAPVCDTNQGLAYYSSCHAGCASTSIINGTTVYNDCTCVPGMGSVIEGLCPTDCSWNIVAFIIIMGALSFTSATGRSANTLIQFRCVNEVDKSLSIGVTEALLCLLAYIPAPVFYGEIMDWACIVWGDNCGIAGNCWIYDGQRLRQVFNFTAAGFLLIGAILDIFVWYHVKGLKIYDEDFEETQDIKNRKPIVKTNSAKNETELLPINDSKNYEN